MLADPALNLSDPADRAEQVDLWLNQVAADAGLLGMEQLIAELRRQSPSAGLKPRRLARR